MKRIVPILVCLVFGLAIMTSCKKDPVIPTLTTSSVTNITISSATSGGVVTKDGGAGVTARGICWGTSENPSISDSHTTDDNGVGSFISNLTDLTANTLYHVRAYATNKAGTAYGSDISFSTTALLVPSLTTSAVTLVTQTTAVSGGNISSDGNAAITAEGVCWATTTGPTVTNSLTTDGTATGIYTSNITGLTPGTLYYVRAYATNSVGTAYGNEISFSAISVSLPTLTTAAMSSVTATTAVSGGNVLTDGGGTVSGRGVCYSLTAGPTITSSIVSDPSGGTGVFTSNLTGLTPGATYHLRAYAVNSSGPAYGNEITFTTLPVAPTVTTTTASAIAQTTATAGGNVTADGGGTITGRGTCWGIAASPTIAGSKTTETGTTGAFVSSLTSLAPGTVYHYRAYATNSVGTSYGTDFTFTTLVALPIVTTTAASTVTQLTAVTGGNVTSVGGGSIIAAGICWGISLNPTISGSKTTDATAIGPFTSNLSGLLAGTLYHIRAYATNSAGTAYGTDMTFTTVNPTPPVVGTAAITSLTNITAVSGGSITSDGNGIISHKGVCWSTSTGPVVTGPKTDEGSGKADFVSNLTSLLPGSTYYVRAYATNSLGTTAYGTEISFKTKVADADGNLYNWVVINGKVWLTEDLKATKYEDGTAIAQVTSGATWSTTITPAYCWYNNDIANKSTYGALYNWYAVDAASNGSKNVCPSLWHVPTDTELEALKTYLGGATVAGGKLKEAGTTHWPIDNGTNDVGFTALPGGERVWSDGGFAQLGTNCYYWSSTIDNWDITLGFGQAIYPAATTMTQLGFHKTSGASVRCIKD